LQCRDKSVSEILTFYSD